MLYSKAIWYKICSNQSELTLKGSDKPSVWQSQGHIALWSVDVKLKLRCIVISGSDDCLNCSSFDFVHKYFFCCQLYSFMSICHCSQNFNSQKHRILMFLFSIKVAENVCASLLTKEPTGKNQSFTTRQKKPTCWRW